MATIKPKSALIGFSVCPLCGGKTHVKKIEAEGKRPYSHCLDEHDQGCSHTHYATNAQQEKLMLAKTRPLGGATATATQAAPAPVQAPEQAAPSVVAPSTPPPATAPKRRGLF